MLVEEVYLSVSLEGPVVLVVEATVVTLAALEFLAVAVIEDP